MSAPVSGALSPVVSAPPPAPGRIATYRRHCACIGRAAKETPMKRPLTLVLAFASVAAGCADPAESFRSAAPAQTAIALSLPSGGASTKSEGEVQEALVGQRATFYELTRTVTLVVNGGVGVTLALLEKITDHAPTTL